MGKYEEEDFQFNFEMIYDEYKASGLTEQYPQPVILKVCLHLFQCFFLKKQKPFLFPN